MITNNGKTVHKLKPANKTVQYKLNETDYSLYAPIKQSHQLTSRLLTFPLQYQVAFEDKCNVCTIMLEVQRLDHAKKSPIKPYISCFRFIYEKPLYSLKKCFYSQPLFLYKSNTINNCKITAKRM